MTMHALMRVLIALTLATAGCRMDAEERRQLVESARESDRTTAAADIVRELRSPSDPARLIYTQPTSLSASSAAAAGAVQAWAPFGSALPDSARRAADGK